MAQSTPQSTAQNLPEHDPEFNLKHAEAEAALENSTGGLGPVSNELMSTDEDSELDEGPRDRQGQRRGETHPTDEGSTAGSHS